MKLKPKTSRRLMILAGGTLSVAAVVGGLFLFRNARKTQTAAAARVEGIQMVAAGDYYPALGKLANFLETPDGENDREAMLAYARARENIEEPDGRHIFEAITVYQKAYALDRSDTKTAEHLLDLCITAGLHPEAREIAERLRPSNIEEATDTHFEVLRQEVNARIGSNPTDATIDAILERMLALRPNDFPTQVVYVEYLRERGRSSDAMKLAERLVASAGSPSDPDRAAQLRLLTALSKRDMPGFRAAEETFEALCELAGLDPLTAGPTRPVKLSAIETLRAATLFDSLGAFQHTLAVLNAGVQQTNDPVVLRVLARRSWMSGRPGDTMFYIPSVDLAPGGTPSEVLVYRALSLIDLGRKAEVGPIVEALAKRTGDYRALGWGPVLTKLSDTKIDAPAESVPIYVEALKVSKGDPVLLTLQGEELQRLGRFAEAREAWEQACSSTLSLGWTRPWLNRANLALAQGKPITAVEAAQVATRIAPRSMSVYATFFRAQAALIESGFRNAGSPQDLLSTADRIDTELGLSTPTQDIKAFRELVLPGRVMLTAMVRGTEAARELLVRSMQELAPLDSETYAQLFQTSFRRGLGIDGDVLPAWEASEGLTPRVGLAKAFTMRAKGDEAGARALLEGKVREHASDSAGTLEAGKVGPALGWRQSMAQFLGAISDPKAKDAWAASADFAPTNLDAQLAAVSAPSVSTDLSLVTRLLDRIATLSKFTPDQLPPQLRLARARALLAPPVTNDNRRAANELLRSLISQEGDLVEAQQLLVQSLMLNDPQAGIRPLRTEAIAAINTLLPSVPDPDRWTLEQARLYAAEGDLRNALSMFERIASSETAALPMRLQAVDEMVALREFDAAARTLEQLRDKVPPSGLAFVNVKLADVYKALKRDRSARDLYASIDPKQLDRADFLLALAEGLAGYGNTDGANKALARLDELDMPSESRLIARARFQARTGDHDGALTRLREATTAAPTNPETWTSLVAYQVERGDMDGAKSTLASARAKLPNDARIASLERQLNVSGTSGISANMPLDDLAKVLDQNPQTQPRAEGVRILSAAEKAGELSSPDKIAELKARFKADPALLTLVARTLSNQNPPQLNLAADVIRECMERHPSSQEAAIFATNLFRRLNRWDDALRAAVTWQQLDGTVESDIVVAETRLLMNQPEGVAQMLEPRVAQAKQAPDSSTNLAILSLYGRALVMNNRQDQAAQELGSMLQVSNGLRTQFWLASAGQLVRPESRVIEWIDRVKPLLDGASEGEQLALAGALANAATRFPGSATKFNEEALTVLRRLTSRTDASARAWEALGSLQQTLNMPEAQASLKQALAKDPKSVFALRGLASLASDPAEAVRFTRQALEATGPEDAFSQVQHGQALMAQARVQTDLAAKRELASQAVNALRAGGASTGNFQGVLIYIEALDATGKVEETLPIYDRLLDANDLPANFRPALQNNLADALVRAGRRGIELDRAHALIEQAVAAQPNAAFFDTMGMVERARGQRGLAIEAFRKAVAMDEKAVGAWVQLAELLKEGSAEEREEAKSIARRLRELGEGIPAALRERVRTLGE